jgi:type VI secretion system protein ImpL
MLDLESGHGPFVSLNGPLVEKAQAALARINVADRAYQLLATRAKASLLPGWVASKSGGAGALVVFDDSIESIQIPYFLTKSGFEQAFVEKLPSIVDEMARDRWVLGAAGQQPAISAQYDRLRQDLVDVYAKAFVGAWRGAIERLKLRRLTAERPSYPLLTAASSVTSPLVRILESIRDETLLTDPEQVGGGGDESDDPAAASDAVKGVSGEPPARMIDAALAPYHRLVEGPAGRRPIDLLISQLNEIRGNLSRLAMGGAPADQLAGRISSGVAKLRTDASSLPQPFARMMNETADDVTREVADSAVARTVETLRDAIALTCQDRIASRYPFARDAERDVSLDDFTRIFGPKGLIDRYASEYVLPAADASGPEWKWRDDSALAKQLGPKALADFQRAAEIRDAFFAGDPAAPSFSFSVTAPAVSAAKLDIDGTTITSRSGGSTTVQWPGPAENHRSALTFRPAGRTPVVIERSGVWSLYRLLDAGRSNSDGTLVTFSLGGRELQYRFNSGPSSSSAALKPLVPAQLRRFRCPNGA